MTSGITSEPVKVGVVGVGSLGEAHARIYRELPGAELIGVYDTNSGRCEEVAQRYSTTAFTSAEALARAADALSIVVPTDQHHAVYSSLALQGVHMLVEKPIAATSAEAEDMVKIAHEHNLILQIGHVERFNPVMSFLDSHLSAPQFIEAIRLAPYPPARQGAQPRGTEVSVVLDLMIHDLEIILHLVKSEVVSVHAVGVPVLSPVEDIANARIAFENGCVANVTASRISAERMRKIRVFESDSYISLDYMEQSGHFHHKSETGIEITNVPIEKREPLWVELDAFIECVASRGNPLVTGSHASRALDLAVDLCERMRTSPS